MRKHPPSSRMYRERFSVRVLEDLPRVEIRRCVPPERFELLADELRIVEDVRFYICFYGSPQRVAVTGRVQTRLQIPCDRCLEHYELRIDTHFESIYLPITMAPKQSMRITDPADLITAYFANDEIDIWTMIHEQILLQVPMKRLCRPDCGYICFRCGAVVLTERCACEEEPVDPRWAPLRALRDRIGQA